MDAIVPVVTGSEPSTLRAPCRPRLRPVTTAAVWLVAGIVGLMGVVMGPALFTKDPPGVGPSPYPPEDPWWAVTVGVGPRSTIIDQYRLGTDPFNSQFKRTAVHVLTPGLPSWAYAHRHPGSSPSVPIGVEDHAFGWPWLALRYRLSQSNSEAPTRLEGGIDVMLLDAIADMDQNDGFFPVTPILHGFIADVLVLGSVAGVPLLGYRVWRRMAFGSRLRHGRCVRCRYDLRAGGLTTCPECGTVSPTFPVF
jgi:hypothetical protein